MSEEKEYKTYPPRKISGSDLRPLGWYSDYMDPTRFTNIEDVRGLFSEIALHDDISDIIVKSGSPVSVKKKGLGNYAITHRPIYDDEALIIAQHISNDNAVSSRISKGMPISGLASLMDKSNFNEEKGTTSFKSRYRYEITACSSSLGEHGLSIVMRPLPETPLSYDQLGIPLSFVKNCIVNDGIVIIAGATGVGKSTTMASVIRYILENDTPIKGNIITHEDPIEVSFENVPTPHSTPMQSQIGQGAHIISYNYANRSAMRRSPDLVLLGELRDEDTIEAAVELSLTGHPVFATTHATNISSIFPRLISRFPQEIQGQKGFDLVDTTRFLVAQKLIRTVDGKRLAVRETLEFTEALRGELIKYAQNTDVLYRIISLIMQNEDFGAVSYASQAKKLREDGVIDEENYRRLVGSYTEFTDEEKDIVRRYSVINK